MRYTVCYSSVNSAAAKCASVQTLENKLTRDVVLVNFRSKFLRADGCAFLRRFSRVVHDGNLA